MYKSWDEWYKIAKKYARNHKGTIASVKNDYVTEDGDKLGLWLQVQRKAYKYRDIPKEERKTKLKPLTDEQVLKLELLGMIWDIRDNEFQVRSICENCFTYEEFKKYRTFLTRIPSRILEAKINYCLNNNLPLIVNKRLNHIFYVSNKNLEIEYGITLEELLKEIEDKKELKNVF